MRSILRVIPLSAALGVALLAASPAGAQDSPFQARSCPVPQGMLGYPVWVRAADGTTLDSAYAHAVADAVARRWEPPSPRRRTIRGQGRLRDRLQPPEPRFPDDWRPQAEHVARTEVTLRRRGRPDVRVAAPSPDRVFNRSVEDAFGEGGPGTPGLPALPAGLDSARVVVGFGVAPEPGASAVRFAVHQTPMTVVQGTLQVGRQRLPGNSAVPPSATARYDVDASGNIVASSIELLASSDRAMDEGIRAGLLRARFIPAQSNCRPVAISVVQQFGDR